MSGLVDRLRASGCVWAEGELAVINRRFPTSAQRSAAVNRRCAGMPLELVIGAAEFAGVAVTVAPGVFIPRPRAEVLVAVADQVASLSQPATSRPIEALDLGCGTGAIAAALKARHPRWHVHACDIDPAAVRCASVNGTRLGFAVHRSDWFAGLPAHLTGRFDLIVAHLPYVPTTDVPLLPQDYRAFEPASTVDGGPDGLDPWRQVARDCACWLSPTGVLLTQVTKSQAASALAVGEAAGLVAQAIRYDETVVIVVTA